MVCKLHIGWVESQVVKLQVKYRLHYGLFFAVSAREQKQDVYGSNSGIQSIRSRGGCTHLGAGDNLPRCGGDAK